MKLFHGEAKYPMIIDFLTCSQLPNARRCVDAQVPASSSLCSTFPDKPLALVAEIETRIAVEVGLSISKSTPLTYTRSAKRNCSTHTVPNGGETGTALSPFCGTFIRSSGAEGFSFAEEN